MLGAGSKCTITCCFIDYIYCGEPQVNVIKIHIESRIIQFVNVEDETRLWEIEAQNIITNTPKHGCKNSSNKQFVEYNNKCDQLYHQYLVFSILIYIYDQILFTKPHILPLMNNDSSSIYSVIQFHIL